MMIGLPASVHSLAQNVGEKASRDLPKSAIQLRNGFGYNGFGGACPPPGAKPYHYQLTVYALSVAKLDIPAHASPVYAGYFILQHKIGEARLTAPTNMRGLPPPWLVR